MKKYYTLKKYKNKNKCYTAYNPKTKRKFSKCTTKTKSNRQIKYLNKWLTHKLSLEI